MQLLCFTTVTLNKKLRIWWIDAMKFTTDITVPGIQRIYHFSQLQFCLSIIGIIIEMSSSWLAYPVRLWHRILGDIIYWVIDRSSGSSVGRRNGWDAIAGARLLIFLIEENRLQAIWDIPRLLFSGAVINEFELENRKKIIKNNVPRIRWL